jgi:hypothetical protein
VLACLRWLRRAGPVYTVLVMPLYVTAGVRARQHLDTAYARHAGPLSSASIPVMITVYVTAGFAAVGTAMLHVRPSAPVAESRLTCIKACQMVWAFMLMHAVNNVCIDSGVGHVKRIARVGGSSPRLDHTVPGPRESAARYAPLAQPARTRSPWRAEAPP